MIVTVGGIKGGVGKSLMAVNLTVLRSNKKKKVLLVDADTQGTASEWSSIRETLQIKTGWTTVKLAATAVRTEVMKLSSAYDDIIIDCGGRDTVSLRAALLVSDIFLIPFQPKSFDIWTAQKVNELVEEARAFNKNMKAYVFINCANPRGSDNQEAQKILSQFSQLSLLPVTIGMRKSFSNATSEGLGIIESGKDEKAIEEITELYESIFI